MYREVEFGIVYGATFEFVLLNEDYMRAMEIESPEIQIWRSIREGRDPKAEDFQVQDHQKPGPSPLDCGQTSPEIPEGSAAYGHCH